MKNSTLTSYVYLVRQGESHLYKIGFTVNPKQRLRQLQTSNATKLVFVCLWKAPESFETHLHHAFAEFRKNGEWFELNTEQIVATTEMHKRFLRYCEIEPIPESLNLKGYRVQSWDDLLPKLQLQAVILEKMPQTADVQQALKIASSAIEMMEGE